MLLSLVPRAPRAPSPQRPLEDTMKNSHGLALIISAALVIGLYWIAFDHQSYITTLQTQVAELRAETVRKLEPKKALFML